MLAGMQCLMLDLHEGTVLVQPRKILAVRLSRLFTPDRGKG